MLRAPHQQARANSGLSSQEHNTRSIARCTCSEGAVSRHAVDGKHRVQHHSRHVRCLASMRGGHFIPGGMPQNPPALTAQPIDSIVELHTQEELQLRNAIAAATAANHPVVMSCVRLTKSMSEFLRLHLANGLTPPYAPSHIRGMTQQIDHVLHVLQQHGTQLLPQDLALLAQACRRLRLISQYAPPLAAQHSMLCNELVSVCGRSPKMQHTDMLVWAIYLHGLAAAGVRSKEFTKLLAGVVSSLPSEPLSPVPSSSRSRACARLLWAYAHVGYAEDVTPLLNYVLGAVQAGFMQAASASHCSQLLWSMATLKLPTPQLLELLRDMMPSLAVWATDHPEQFTLPIISSTCFALATAGVTVTDDKGIGGLEDWNSVVSSLVASGGLHAAVNEEAAQLHWAAKQMQADWFTQAPAPQDPAPATNPGEQQVPSSNPSRSLFNVSPMSSQAAMMMDPDETLHHASNGNDALPPIHPELSFLRGTISDEDSHGSDIWRRDY